MIKLKEAKKKDDPCWVGYKQYGMKDKDGRKVPNKKIQSLCKK